MSSFLFVWQLKGNPLGAGGNVNFKRLGGT